MSHTAALSGIPENTRELVATKFTEVWGIPTWSGEGGSGEHCRFQYPCVRGSFARTSKEPMATGSRFRTKTGASATAVALPSLTSTLATPEKSSPTTQDAVG